MEKFQNFLNSLFNKSKEVGGTALEKITQFGEFLAPSDSSKSNNPSVQKGLLTPPEFITKDGALASVFKSGGVLTTEEGKKTELGDTFEDEKKKKKVPKERNYLEENKQLLEQIAGLSEKARDRSALRTGISNLALSPLIGGEAAMNAAAEINRLTIANMGSMAAQNAVLAANPSKQKIAGKYFQL